MVAQTSERTERGDENQDARLAEVARSAIGGSEDAFAELHEILAGRVFNLVFRSVHDRTTTEDLCQDIWLKVHGQIGRLRSPEAVRAWVYQIASRACVDHARAQKNRTTTNIDTVEYLFETARDQPEATAVRASQLRVVWQALAAMTPRQSIALYLKQVDGCSYQEIATILGCPISTVETLLFRARQSFSRSFERVDSSPAERCDMTRKIMARLVDHEPSAFQETALQAHVDECRPCRGELASQRSAAATYGALPLLPATGVLVLEVAATAGGAAATTATGGMLARIISIVTLKTKATIIGGAVAGSLAVGAVAVDVTGVSNPISGGDAGAASQTSSNGATAGGDVLAPLPPGASRGDEPGRPGMTGPDQGGGRPGLDPDHSDSDDDDQPADTAAPAGVPGGGATSGPPDATGTPEPGSPPQASLDDTVGGVIGGTEEVVNGTVGAVNDLVDQVLDPLDLPQPIEDLVPELPEVDLPDLPLPEVPLPTVELPDLPLPTVEVPPLLPPPAGTPEPEPEETPEPDCFLLIVCG
jgi:RNA polymerase sigma-70 factor (ECF subfamily)